MNARARLRTLEESLSPTEAVLRWLAEARSFGGFAEYAASTLEAPEGAAPLEGVLARVEAAARREQPHGSRATPAAVIAGAIEDAVFRYELVLRLNAATIELCEQLAPRLRMLQVALAAPDDPALAGETTAHAGSAPIERLAAAWGEQLHDLVATVAITDEARTAIERDYLEGAGVLFTDVARAWRTIGDELRHLSEREPQAQGLGGPAPRLRRPAPRSRSRVSLARAGQARAAAIAADARLAALMALGEGARATELIRARIGNGEGTDPRLAIWALERLSWPLRGPAADERSESSPSAVARPGPDAETAYNKARLEAAGKLMALADLIRKMEPTGRDGTPADPEEDNPFAKMTPAQQAADLRIMAEEIERRAAASAQV